MPTLRLIKQAGARVGDALLGGDPIELVLRVTLLIFLIGPNLFGLDWHYKLIFQILAIVGLAAPAVGGSTAFWCGVTGLTILKTFDHWWMQDNHVFLLTWWCLTITISRFAADPKRVMSTNARLLIGLSFLFAIAWKGILSPDYMHGDYFHYTFLTDSRFSQMGTLLCGMDNEQYQSNFKAIRLLSDFKVEAQSVQLRGTDSLRTLAVVVTWWTVLIEGLLALLFLLPTRFRLARYRDAALLFFAWTTYLAAPVKTFGWTLMTLGLAQCDSGARRTRICYLLTYPLLLIYEQAPIWPTINKLASAFLG